MLSPPVDHARPHCDGRRRGQQGGVLVDTAWAGGLEPVLDVAAPAPGPAPKQVRATREEASNLSAQVEILQKMKETSIFYQYSFYLTAKYSSLPGQ